MKTQRNTSKLLAAAAAGMFLLTGCWQDSSTGSESNTSESTIEGQVTGELSLAKRASQGGGTAFQGGGIEGATVTVVRLKADGSFETVSRSDVKTDAQGRFSIEAGAEAASGLIVVARKEAREFKAVVSGEVKKGAKTYCRPLDVESSVEAEVYAKVRADGKSGSVSFADIAAHVDGAVAAKVEGNAETRAAATAFLAAQLETEAETRVSVLFQSTGKVTQAQIEKMDGSRLKAQAALEASLNTAARTEAGVTVEARANAEGECLKAKWIAVTDAGIAVGEFAKAHEASFHAMVMGHASAAVDSGTSFVWLKRIALQNAISLEAALEADMKASGGNASLVAEAGATLKASLGNARNEIEIDSAFSRCRQSIALGIGAALEGSLGGRIGLPDSSAARSAFELSLKSATTAEAVASAYTRFYADAEAEIKAGFAGTLDPARLEAATRAALFVSLQGPVDGGRIEGGFSLSGSVEGGLSGANVQLAKVNPDGSLEIISTARVETDAKGDFSIKTDSALPGSVVVVVTKDSSTFMTVIDSKASDSVTVGVETTVETQVYQKAVQEGRTDITPADVKAQVDSSVAVSLKGNDSLMVSLLATMDAAAKAQVKFLTDSGLGLAGTSLVLISTARATAQAKLETDLKAAAGESAKVKAAYDSYHEALMEAYLKAGLNASAYARSMQVYAQAMANASLSLSVEARAALIRSGHSQAARGLRSAMEIQMKAAGSSEAVLKAVVEAGTALQASVDASSKVETIESAYAAYHAAMVAALRSAILLHATAISSVDSSIRGEAGARADLMAAIRAEAGSDGISRAHVEFAAQVEAEVGGAFKGGLGGPSSTQITVITQVLLLASMCGGV